MTATRSSPTDTAGPYTATPAEDALDGRRSAQRHAATETPEERSFPPRLVLQQSQSRNVWMQLGRDITRMVVLGVADVLAFWTMRFCFDALRDGALGSWLASVASSLVPQGFLGGWQFAVALLIGLALVGAYRAGDARRDSGRLFAGSALATLVGLYGALWTDPVLATAGRAIVVAACFGLTLTVSRLVIDWAVWKVRPGIGVARTIVVAHDDADWEDLATILRRARDFMVVGRINLAKRLTGGVQPRLAALGRTIEATRAEAVLLWGNLTDDEFAYSIDVALAAGCRLLAGARTSFGAVEPRGVWIGGRQLIELTPPVLRAWQQMLKRVTDVLAAGLGLVFLSPLFVGVSLAIMIESGRPIFFRQERMGRGGRGFRIFKFRSMVRDAETRLEGLRSASLYGDQRLFKVVQDPRVTRVGRLLRRTSIDELPQLFNVLLGDMSLVGPRPPLPAEVAKYDEHHYRRFDVKPGITGPWQVGGRNTITDFDEVVRMESQYVRNWSLMEDLRILLRTFPAVFSGRGAH